MLEENVHDKYFFFTRIYSKPHDAIDAVFTPTCSESRTYLLERSSIQPDSHSILDKVFNAKYHPSPEFAALEREEGIFDQTLNFRDMAKYNIFLMCSEA